MQPKSKKYFIRIILLISFLNMGALGIVDDVKAAPSITSTSGTTSEGETITLNGGNFGVNAAPGTNNTQWLGGSTGNIEQGNVNSEVNLPAGWYTDTTSSARQKPIYSTTKVHSGTKSIKSYFPETSQYSSGFWFVNDTPIPSIYVSWWVYIENLSCNGDCAGNSQWKIFRLTPGETGGIYADQENNWYLPQQVAAPAATFVDSNKMFVNFCSDNTYPTYDTYCFAGENTGVGIYRPHDSGIIEGGWRRIEIIAKESTPGEEDGTIIARVLNGTDTIKDYVDYDGNTRTRTSTTPRWDSAVWENYCGNGLDVADIYQDDIFIQIGSQARVEIGDAPVWSDCTHREVQSATAWANGEISLTFNQGSFSNGDTAYLFVVDADGNTSEGYPITLGNSVSSDLTPPIVPSGLNVF